MSEQVFTDVLGETVVLSDSVRAVILLKHPEVSEFINRIGDALLTPSEIRQSVHDERVILYYRYEDQVLAGKFVVVVVKRVERNFVSTMYATDKVKSGDVIWKK